MIIGVDTGGTFTDFVFLKDGRWHILKVPSTPEDPSEAILTGIKQIAPEGEVTILHGSTVATNTLLERKGAKTALVTNKGFEDVIEIQRQNRKRIYDLCYRKPSPLVPAELRFGVSGRISSKGEVLEDIDTSEVEALAQRIKDLGVESVAISLLFCFLFPEHEKRVEEILKKNIPNVFSSSSILPVFREYERTSTVVINAYVAPIMGKYLKKLSSGLGEKRVRIMQSNGGSISVQKASREAVRTILSGPAGGVVAAQRLGEITGYKNLITLDMGGTSTDVSLIKDGHVRLTTDYEIDGLPVGIQVIDIHTIGAGGGSIARIDEGGALKVGPESAGADPGPVCYGKGNKVTITDAHVYLKRIFPEFFLGGTMKIYPERIPSFLNPLAKEANMSPQEMAHGIITVANSNMEKAIRVVSVEKGHDPQDFSLLVFGGAAALHAAELARSMGIPKVIVPQNPGAFSAIGILLSDVVMDYSMTVMMYEPNPKEIEEKLTQLAHKASQDMRKEGFAEFKAFYYLSCRFKGQSYEIEIPYSENYKEVFKEAYKRLYGYCPEDKGVEVVNVILRAVGETHKPKFPEIPKGDKIPPKESLLGTFEGKKIYLRDKLLHRNIIDGPSIVVEYSSTTFVPEDYLLEVDRWGNLILRSKNGS